MKLLLVVIACAGCATAKKDDGVPRASHELVSGAGSVKGGGMRMDVSIGHAFSQKPIKATGLVMKSASPVIP
ncbi:hypothetical protein BH11MYX1_BH11MYX1_35920 [soil metagenome]